MKEMEECGFYHVCTDGTVLPWMFKDEQDFIAGINRIGICKIISGVLVWAYTLMDNHVHFLLNGSLLQCKKFIDRYKFITGMWISRKYNEPQPLKGLPTSIIPLKTDEDIRNTIAYIDRNSIVAGFDGLPYDYPWSSAKLLFRKGNREYTSGYKISDFSKNALRDPLKTRVTLPENWTFDAHGMLNPSCFTEWEKVEQLFVSPIRHMYYINKKIEGEIDLTLSQGHKTFIPDKDLRPITEKLSTEKFGVSDIRKLPIKSRISLARTLRREYASTPKQIARMVYLDIDTLKGFI